MSCLTFADFSCSEHLPVICSRTSIAVIPLPLVSRSRAHSAIARDGLHGRGEPLTINKVFVLQTEAAEVRKALQWQYHAVTEDEGCLACRPKQWWCLSRSTAHLIGPRLQGHSANKVVILRTSSEGNRVLPVCEGTCMPCKPKGRT